MPIVRKIACNGGWGAIWKVTEEFDTLCDMLINGSDYRTKALTKFTLPKRRLEYIAVRVLLQTLMQEEVEIAYHATGRPFLTNSSTNISISHTHGYVAILLSDTHIPGIDIERITPKALTLKERIVGPSENAHTTEEVILHWCAKETAYKILDAEGIDFIKDLQLFNQGSDIHALPTNGNVGLKYNLTNGLNGTYDIDYLITDDYIMTYSFCDRKPDFKG